MAKHYVLAILMLVSLTLIQQSLGDCKFTRFEILCRKKIKNRNKLIRIVIIFQVLTELDMPVGLTTGNTVTNRAQVSYIFY